MSAQTLTQTHPLGVPADRRPWGIYARKSRIGVGATITKENQWGACTDYVQGVAPGAELVRFFDNASGWDEDAPRPDFQRMLRMVERGELAGIVAWHVDRYTRQVGVGEHLWQLCKASRTQLHTKLGGHQTSALAFTVQNAVARDESDVKSERLKLKHAQLAADGMPHGGRRMYGWNVQRTQLVPDEAAHIRWAAKRILGGASMRSTVAGMTARGAVTVSGGIWQASNLGTYLRRPALAGLRVHHGQVVGEASWPALLDRGTWDALRTLLDNPERRVSRKAPRVYLLTGIARCASCGGPMRGRSNASAGLPAAYFCDSAAKCAYRRADLVDAQVRAWVVARLAELDVTGALATPADEAELRHAELAEEIAQVRAGMATVARLVLSGAFDEAQAAAASDEARQQLAALETAQRELALEQRQPVEVLAGLAGMANAAQLFDALPLERRKAVVALLCTVTVHPQGKGGRTYDPELVVVQARS